MDKQKEFLDKVLERLLKDTVITDSKITFPFAIFKQEELTGDSLLSVSIWMDGRWENHKYPQRFEKYVNDIYGVTYMESLGLWNSYMDIIEKEVLKRLRRNKSNVATTWNLGRHDINESGDKQKEYLDKVVHYFVERFKEVDGRPDSTRLINSMDDFVDFGETFGLSDLELNYVYHRYKYVQGWDEEDKSSWYLDKNINESVNKEKYLDKIVEHLVNETKYDTDHHNVYIIKFPFSDTWEVFGSHGVMSSIYDIYPKRFENYRWNFDQEMIDTFGLLEHESDYIWEKYFEGARFFGKEYANSKGSINESHVDVLPYMDDTEFIKDFTKDLNEKQKGYLDKVVEHILRETEIDYEKRRVHYPFSSIVNPGLKGLVGDSTYSFNYTLPFSGPFIRYCNTIFPLSKDEMRYVHVMYTGILDSKIRKYYVDNDIYHKYYNIMGTNRLRDYGHY